MIAPMCFECSDWFRLYLRNLDLTIRRPGRIGGSTIPTSLSSPALNHTLCLMPLKGHRRTEREKTHAAVIACKIG